MITAYFLKWCAQDGIFDQNLWIFLCSMKSRLKRTEKIWVAPYVRHYDHHAESSLAISWPPLVSPAHCYQKSLLPAYQAMMEKRLIRWVSSFCCTSSHSNITLPKISCKHITKASMQNIKQPKVHLNFTKCTYKEKWPQFKSLTRSNKLHLSRQNS